MEYFYLEKKFLRVGVSPFGTESTDRGGRVEYSTLEISSRVFERFKGGVDQGKTDLW